MADKEFRTIDEQIALLKSRGLAVPDEKQAADFLLLNNYYRISGYSLTLRNHDAFYSKATFQNIIDIYSFDHELRHVLMRFIEIIEVAMKSVYSYEFAKVHGSFGYLDESNFTDLKQYKKTMAKAIEQRENRHPHEAYLKHFLDELKQDIPLWAFVDLLTISDISFLYSITETSIRQTIARCFGLFMNDGYLILEKFLKSMTIIRNLCAHGNRLYNRLFEQKPSLSKRDWALLIQNDDGTADNAHLYGFIFIMRRLLTKQDFSTFKESLLGLSTKYPFVSLRYYGFRDDWKKML
ncbi:MAG: Abi family protein [Clostridia bacterium]